MTLAREAVAELAEKGLPLCEIAAVVGVGKNTVERDLSVPNGTGGDETPRYDAGSGTTDAPFGPPTDECYTVGDILAFVRELAAISDPRHAPIYRAVEPERIRAGARVAQQILETHLELRQRVGRGARTGRRKHAQEIYRLLADTNDVNLELAVAALSIPCYFATQARRGD